MTSTEKLPDPVKEESSEVESQGSDEPSNESENSSTGSEVSSGSETPQVSDNSEVEQNNSHQDAPATEEQKVPQVPEELPATEMSQDPTESPQATVSHPAEVTKTEEQNPSTDLQPEDSHSEASHHQESEAQIFTETTKAPQVTNEIPESTPQEHLVAPTTTEEPPEEAPRIPGEGSCLVEGKTYAHNTIVPTENPCQEICRCFSSIVSCKPRDCPPAPSADETCMPVSTPGSCCPTYMCGKHISFS